MKARFADLPSRAQIAIAIGVVLIYATLWFLLVAPKRSEAASVSEDVVAAQLELTTAQLEARRPTRRKRDSSVTDVLRLAKAMPSSADQAGLVLELDRLARSANVTLGSITPSEPVLGSGGTTTIPVVVTATGSYRQITRFLKHTRALCRRERWRSPRNGSALDDADRRARRVECQRIPVNPDATITLNAFVYDGPIIPATPTPTTTTTEDASSGATAAGSTP